jgi:hypothetical protein
METKSEAAATTEARAEVATTVDDLLRSLLRVRELGEGLDGTPTATPALMQEPVDESVLAPLAPHEHALVFNPGHPIAIVSASTADIVPYSRHGHANHIAYAKKHGYTLYLYLSMEAMIAGTGTTFLPKQAKAAKPSPIGSEQICSRQAIESIIESIIAGLLPLISAQPENNTSHDNTSHTSRELSAVSRRLLEISLSTRGNSGATSAGVAPAADDAPAAGAAAATLLRTYVKHDAQAWLIQSHGEGAVHSEIAIAAGTVAGLWLRYKHSQHQGERDSGVIGSTAAAAAMAAGGATKEALKALSKAMAGMKAPEHQVRHNCWGKIVAVLRVMDMKEAKEDASGDGEQASGDGEQRLERKHKWVMWVDADTLFVNMNRTVEEFIGDEDQEMDAEQIVRAVDGNGGIRQHHLLVCNHSYHPLHTSTLDEGGWLFNSGVMLYRNSDRAPCASGHCDAIPGAAQQRQGQGEQIKAAQTGGEWSRSLLWRVWHSPPPHDYVIRGDQPAIITEIAREV